MPTPRPNTTSCLKDVSLHAQQKHETSYIHIKTLLIAVISHFCELEKRNNFIQKSTTHELPHYQRASMSIIISKT